MLNCSLIFDFITKFGKLHRRVERERKLETLYRAITLKTALILIIVNFSLSATARCLCGIRNLPTDRVVGGEEATPHEFPWQVALVGPRGYIFCSGSLLNNRYVVTAAHCVKRLRAWQVTVVLGEHTPGDWNRWRRKVAVDELIPHPQFEKEFFTNDIALIRMVRSVRFTATQRPACLFRPSKNYDEGVALASGWGRLKEGGFFARTLMKVRVPIISLAQCRRAYGEYVIASSEICGMHKPGGRDTCQGDSGAPLVYRYRSRYYLIGIVSWGIGCARRNIPSVYTRVDKFYPWLDKNTEDADFCTD